MSEYRTTLTKRAADDITEIGDYIHFSLSKPDISRDFIKGLKTSISQLKLFPYKFPLVQDTILQKQDIRCMPYKNYYIFYKNHRKYQNNYHLENRLSKKKLEKYSYIDSPSPAKHHIQHPR